MFHLIYEVWHDRESDSLACWIVSKQADKVRATTMPDAVFVRTYRASSHGDAMQQHHAAENWKPYKSVPGLTDIHFTAEDFRFQQAYMAERSK